eukprot:scpid67470/ scgid4907/ Docking protein 5; Downstream of tyrosine kinase 5; Insulin receptor substrate 6
MHLCLCLSALQSRKKWVKLVEYGQTRDLRLDIFATEKAARDGEPCRECVRLDDAKLAIRTSKHKYTFIIELNSENMEREQLMFASDSDTDADDWVDAINRMLMQSSSSHRRLGSSAAVIGRPPDINKLTSLGDGRFYVIPTVYHDRLHCRPGETCVLQTTPDKLILLNETGHDTLVEWNLAALRRYGNTSEYFQFEAGRRTTTGEGVFTMMTKDGQGIYDLVHMYTQELVRKSKVGTQRTGSLPGVCLNRAGSIASSHSPASNRSSISSVGSLPSPNTALTSSSLPPGVTGGVITGSLRPHSQSFDRGTPSADQSTYQTLDASSQESNQYQARSDMVGQRSHSVSTGTAGAAAEPENSYQGLSALTTDNPPTYMDVVASDMQNMRIANGGGASGSGGGGAANGGTNGPSAGVYQPLDITTRLQPASGASTDSSTYQPISLVGVESNTYQGVSLPANRQTGEQSTYQALQ